MLEILLGTVVFTGLVMALTLVVLGARRVIWGRGRARLTVNGEQVIESSLGGKVLAALSNGGIHPPTSCGGVGTCGLCRVQVTGETADDALPTERAQLSAAAIADGYRLACQVVVRGDMNITVADDLLGVKTWRCLIERTRALSPLIKEITFALPEGESGDFAAGRYVLVGAPKFKLAFADIDIPPEFENTWQRMGVRDLDVESQTAQTRAYSLVNRPGEQGLTLNIRLALPPGAHPNAPPGIVSSYLFGLHTGDRVDVSGPYGDFFVQDTDREIILIGGGVGMAPIYAHVHDQLERKKTQRPIRYWYGARAVQDLYYSDDLDALAQTYENFSWTPVLSDPADKDVWTGETGFVHEAVYRQYLSTHPDPNACEYYLCGPPLMIQAVRAMLDKLGVEDDNIYSDDFGV